MFRKTIFSILLTLTVSLTGASTLDAAEVWRLSETSSTTISGDLTLGCSSKRVHRPLG